MTEEKTAQATSSIADQIRLREGKAAQLRERGHEPYPAGTHVTATTGHIREVHASDDAKVLEAEPTGPYTIAGRVIGIRTMGKATFLSLRDRDGDLQAFVKKDKVGEESYETLKLLDLGDIAWVKGRAMRTRTGELSIEAGEGGFQLLCKALRPLPEKWHGLQDVETRYRQRYVDLAVNLEVRETFLRRTKLITGMRRFLDEREFVEVETPILHTPEQAGGAAARTFQTHHNALDIPLKLRIATELHLKRLVVSGLERVYEIGRIFRNEGIDRTHCPEFTTIEFYQAYATYQDLMKLTEDMISRLCTEVTGSMEAPYQGTVIDYRAPWPRVSMLGEVARLYRIEGSDSEKLDRFAKLTRADFGAPTTEKEALFKLGKAESTGEQIAWAFETFCEPLLPRDKPSFVVDFPIEISPLARKRDGEPRLVDRFEAFAGGFEIANAFTELNDPRDQESRFRAQVEAAKRGNEEAMPYDRDFVRALEHGMPPTAGEGIGIDRLVMLFTDSPSIRDVILFPLLRPEAEGT
jgi:lysyl-tRNA synthetase, class II